MERDVDYYLSEVEIGELEGHIDRIFNNEPISEQAIVKLCDKAKEILVAEPNVLAVSAPVTVVGDIHGQLYDLKELFRIAGTAPNTNFLFLGDYVDRGYYSVESVTLILSLKVRYKDRGI